jgi:putative nucleotidyltransferase with HDIG domain
MPELDDLAKRARDLEIENRRLKAALSDLERSYDITLQSLGDALDLKEGSKGNHSRRVCAFSMSIARAMGLPQDQVAVIARGAFLHDIGKMAIPHQILVKPGPLDAYETAIMREHCFKGYQVTNKIPFLAEPSEIVYAHHEHYDGTGYPRGLKGKQIPWGQGLSLLRTRWIRSHLTSLTAQPGVLWRLAKKYGRGRDASSTLRSS